MLLEHALLLHEKKVVGLKGVWVDPNKDVHEGRILEITRSQGRFRLAIEGLWGSKPITVEQPSQQSGKTQPHLVQQQNGTLVDAQFGTLMIKIDHFRDDPHEWLAQLHISSPREHIIQESHPIAVGEH